MKTTFTFPFFFFFHKKRGLKENTLFKGKETVHLFLIVLLKMEMGSQNKNCHFLELCLNIIFSILLHEEDQSRVADIVGITWESEEEAVLIYTSCRTDSKTIMLVFWFGVGVFFVAFLNHSSCFSTHQDDILESQC